MSARHWLLLVGFVVASAVLIASPGLLWRDLLLVAAGSLAGTWSYAGVVTKALEVGAEPPRW